MSARPRKGTRVGFAPAEGAAAVAAPSGVAGLRFTIEARHGGSVLVNLADLQPRPLALAFAAALRREAGPTGSLGTASTIKKYPTAYRHFFAHLRDHAPDVQRPADLRAAHLDDFDAALAAAGFSSLYRYATVSRQISALRAMAADRPGLLETGLRDRLGYVSVGPIGSCRPRDAYSPSVARQLRDAARADVERLFRRIGSPLADANDEALRRADAAISEHGRIGYTHTALTKVMRERRRRGLPTASLINDLHGRHHLLAADLPPLLVLLSLETGLEPECLKGLTVDCLRDASAGTVGVAYLKRRARGAEHKTIRVRDGGPGTPGGLLRRLIAVTTAARRQANTDCLWVYPCAGKLTIGILHPRQTLDAWTVRHGVNDDDGRPLRLLLSRLRKTHKALWYRKTEGHLARFAVGHTVEVAARAYAELPSLRPLHENAVADAFAEVVAAATGAPTVLPPEAEAAWRAAPVLADGTAPRADVAGLLAGEQDVWLAACTGFLHSPFGAPGTPCPQPFWGCLECGNAVTARKLPAILAFLAFAEGERAGLSADEWRFKFGRVHARITRQILPAFPDAVLAEARRTAGAAELYLQPEARA